MKAEKIYSKLEKQYAKRKFTTLIRKIDDSEIEEISKGFVLGLSKDFVLIQESEEFKTLGYQVFPLNTISKVRYNKFDKTYEKILSKEGLLDKVVLKHKINLSDWKSLCKSVQKTGLTIISECEHPDLNSFCIGELKRVNNKSISIRYFNAEGIADKENTKNKYKNITKLSFDDHYANVFSKYVKQKK